MWQFLDHNLWQTITMLLAVVAAYCIGRKQNEINQQLLEINYLPSLAMIYDNNKKQIQIFNQGKTNIYFYGTRFNNGEKKIEEEPRIVTPGISTHYFLPIDKIQDSLKSLGDGEYQSSLELYFQTENKKKYISRHCLYISMKNNEITDIRTQTIGHELSN